MTGALTKTHLQCARKRKPCQSGFQGPWEWSAGGDQAAQFILFGSGFARESRGVCFQVFQTGAGIVENDAVFGVEKAGGEKFLQRRDAGGAFGSGKDALQAAEFEAGGAHIGI